MTVPYLITMKYTLTKDIIVNAISQDDAVGTAYALEHSGAIDVSVNDDFSEVECVVQGVAEPGDYEGWRVQIFDERGVEVL